MTVKWLKSIIARSFSSAGGLIPGIAPDFIERVKSIDWESYETAHGDASSIPYLLIAVATDIEEEAFVAVTGLSDRLCHQHAFVSPAAGRALPFVLELIECVGDALLEPLLGLTLGLCECTNKLKRADLARLGGDPMPQDWELDIRSSIASQQALFQKLMNHSNQNIVELAQAIVEDLDSWQPSRERQLLPRFHRPAKS